MTPYSILINTCDKFEDCWDPFFKLFSLFWPDYKGKIYLNTEYKNYSYGNLNIIPLKIAQKTHTGKILTWSECLIHALNKIDSNVVLYMQEDYFLKGKVNNNKINEYAALMSNNTEMSCIHLTDQALQSEQKSKYKGLNKVKLKQRYRISCQAALWKKDVLIKHLRPNENAWDFEEFGSQRSAIYNDNFYVVDKQKDIQNRNNIIPYIFTGIIQGRWFEEVVPLFKKHHINIDYSKRGFVNNRVKKPLKEKFIYQLDKTCKMIRNQIELFKLKTNHPSKN